MLEVTDRLAADLLKTHPNSAVLFFTKIRQIISYNTALEAKEIFYGENEICKSYFDGVHKGKRGRGAGGKTIVLGIFKLQGKVYTVVIENTKTSTLMAEIACKQSLTASCILTDSVYRLLSQL